LPTTKGFWPATMGMSRRAVIAERQDGPTTTSVSWAKAW
jgi:hypothetical protein